MKDCPYLQQRDEIYHGGERHDLYCSYHLEWCPNCDRCYVNKQERNEDEY